MRANLISIARSSSVGVVFVCFFDGVCGGGAALFCANGACIAVVACVAILTACARGTMGGMAFACGASISVRAFFAVCWEHGVFGALVTLGVASVVAIAGFSGAGGVGGIVGACCVCGARGACGVCGVCGACCLCSAVGCSGCCRVVCWLLRVISVRYLLCWCTIIFVVSSSLSPPLLPYSAA